MVLTAEPLQRRKPIVAFRPAAPMYVVPLTTEMRTLAYVTRKLLDQRPVRQFLPTVGRSHKPFRVGKPMARYQSLVWQFVWSVSFHSLPPILVALKSATTISVAASQ
jgi:hypothetical protein